MRKPIRAAIAAMALGLAPAAKRPAAAGPAALWRTATSDMLSRMSTPVERAALVASLWAERKDAQCAVPALYGAEAGAAPVNVRRAAGGKGARALQERLAQSGYQFVAACEAEETPLMERAPVRQWTVAVQPAAAKAA